MTASRTACSAYVWSIVEVDDPWVRWTNPIILSLLDICKCAYEWPTLMQVKVINVINMSNNGYFVLHVVLIEPPTVSLYHSLRDLFFLVKLPAIKILFQIIWIIAIIDICLAHTK